MPLLDDLVLLQKRHLKDNADLSSELEKIAVSLDAGTHVDAQAFFSLFESILQSTSVRWEVLSFCVSIVLKLCCESTVGLVENLVYLLLEHEEPRIRVQACQLVPVLCRICDGTPMLDEFSDNLMSALCSNMERTESTREALLGDAPLISLDDTTGWNKLESYLYASQLMIESVVNSEQEYRRNFLLLPVNDYADGAELSVADLLVRDASVHQNRHVREMTYPFISRYLAAWKNRQRPSCVDDSCDPHNWSAENSALAGVLVEAVRVGMTDPWSQIRLKATQTCGDLLLCLLPLGGGGGGGRLVDQYWPHLLPGLCLNRFYTAEAVKTAAASAWREVMGTSGRQLLTAHLSAAVEHYMAACGSSNHMVSEAGLHALGEVLKRLDRDAVTSHVPSIVATLSRCLSDSRWPVRDAACLSSGIAARWYPRECSAQLSEFLALWDRNLQDCIWSVRENAAFAYSDALQCAATCPDVAEAADVSRRVLSNCVAFLNRHLLSALGVKSSPAVKPSMRNFSFLPPSMLAPKPAMPGLDDPFPSQDLDAPPRKGWGCCVDCVELRQSVPWEVTQGALYLLRELSRVCSSEVRVERRKRADGTLENSRDGNADGEKLCYLDAVWLLLEAENVDNCEKLLSAVYDEVPAIVQSLEVSGARLPQSDVDRLKSALARDLQWSRGGEVNADLANRNESKYKANRVAAAAAAAKGGGATGVPAVRPFKSNRRLMAEKCLEALAAQGWSAQDLAAQFEGSAREMVNGLFALE